MPASDTHAHLDHMPRAELPYGAGRVCAALDDWLLQCHGVTSGGHHVGQLLDLLADEGVELFCAGDVARIRDERDRARSALSTAKKAMVLALAADAADPLSVCAEGGGRGDGS